MIGLDYLKIGGEGAALTGLGIEIAQKRAGKTPATGGGIGGERQKLCLVRRRAPDQKCP